MVRGAALIVQDGQVALIERRNSERGRHYYLFPGGTMEEGESPEAAAVREVEEELGLEIALGPLVAEVLYGGNSQFYFAATVLGGRFGCGRGPEMLGQDAPDAGSYVAIWMPITDLLLHRIYPRAVAEIVVDAATQGWPRDTRRIMDEGDEQ